MKIKVLDSAMEDLCDARCFYERQGEGLGAFFFDSLFSDIDSLVLYAGIHQKVFGYHRMLSKRFPYAVYYSVEGDLAVAWRVLDLRRHPSKTQEDLKDLRDAVRKEQDVKGLTLSQARRELSI